MATQPGLNINIERGARGGRALHLQVEHRERPVEVVVGQVFAGGVALATRTVECAEAGASSPEQVRALMSSVARELLAESEEGRFDLPRAPAPRLAPPASPALALGAPALGARLPLSPNALAEAPALKPLASQPAAGARPHPAARGASLVTLYEPLSATPPAAELLPEPIASLLAALLGAQERERGGERGGE